MKYTTKFAQVVMAQGVEITASDAKLVLDWCTAASQPDTKGDSWLNITMIAAISGDPTFGNWTYDRLETTLGSQGIAPSAAPVTQPDSLFIISLIAARVGRSVVEVLRPASGALSATNMAP